MRNGIRTVVLSLVLLAVCAVGSLGVVQELRAVEERDALEWLSDFIDSAGEICDKAAYGPGRKYSMARRCCEGLAMDKLRELITRHEGRWFGLGDAKVRISDNLMELGAVPEPAVLAKRFLTANQYKTCERAAGLQFIEEFDVEANENYICFFNPNIEKKECRSR